MIKEKENININVHAKENESLYKSIKLIVSDLDGTLLNSSGSLSEKTISTVKELNKRGIMFSIASGRSDKMCTTFINQLDINIPVISSNGALIRNINSNKIIRENLINISDAITIMDFCEDSKLDYIAYTSEKVFFTKESKRINKFYNYNEIALSNNTEPMLLHFYDNNHIEIANEGLIKIVVFEDDGSHLKDACSYLNNFENISYIFSEHNVLDISSKNTSKGNALKELTEHLNLSPKEVACFGDFLNDISMIEYAGLGIAMGDAPDEVKAVADYITDNNDNDGVAKLIDELILNIK